MATGSEQNADRPAVIVSNDLGNRHAPIVELVYLTTRKKASLPTHVYIGSAEKPSIALCEQIVTVCKSRLQRHIGSVTAEEMHNIEKALTKSLGIHRTGGNDMQITLATPFGEMKFDMPPERATDLIQRAFQYAAGQEPEKAAPKMAQEAPPVAQEPPKAPQPKGRPQSRVERMFGDFKASKTVEPKKPEPQREPEAYKGFLIIDGAARPQAAPPQVQMRQHVQLQDERHGRHIRVAVPELRQPGRLDAEQARGHLRHHFGLRRQLWN